MILRSAAACLVALLSIERAFACSVVIPPECGSSEYRKMAKDAVAASTAIVDGEVVQPFIEGKQNAIFRAIHVPKGPSKEFFEIGEWDSCSLRLNRAGENRRMLLVGRPEICDLWNDGSNARYEDHLLKSDRKKVWPYVAGQDPTPVTIR